MVLVTGATGLVGSHLLYFLLKRGKSVKAIYRDSNKINPVKRVFGYFDSHFEEMFSKIQWVQADLTDIFSIENALQRVDEVYHAAGEVDFNSKYFSALKKSNIEGTANLINICLHLSIKKFCHISSVAVFSSSHKPYIDEECFWNPDENNSGYAISKYGAEMEVWRGIQEGMQAVILNPGVILGSGYWEKGTGKIFSKVQQGLSFYSKGSMGFVDVVDVANIAIALMEENKMNEQYILVSENESYKNLLQKIAVAFNKKPPTVALKKWILEFAWRFDFVISSLFFKKQQLFRSIAASMNKKSHYNNQKILTETHVTFTPLDQTITRIVNNFNADLNL